MKPTPTQIDAAIAKTPFIPNSINRAWMAEALSAALSVQPAAAVVGEPVGDIAYNAGLEIRYAIAASGVDPIQHIPEVDAIIERRLAEARKAAFIEAATLIDEGFDRGIKSKRDTCAHGKFEWEDCEQCASAAIRAKAEETRA